MIEQIAQWVAPGFVGAGSVLLIQWMRSGDARFTVNADLKKHWTNTTLELVAELRRELTEAKGELAGLRPIERRLAHFEEALDHLHALLESETTAEWKAAERRARAFLRRMRGDEMRGELRNVVQTQISARRLIDGEEE